MFKEERSKPTFSWDLLGDVEIGRPNLGRTTDVAVYRLMQFTLRDILISKHGVQSADEIFYEAGLLAGKQFYINVIRAKEDFNSFVADLQMALKTLNIGILRVESFSSDGKSLTLTVAEDLDCSGLPLCEEQICTYDEGFIAGLLSEHTGASWKVKEVDCWCSGDRVCRFQANQLD